jgi:hypothetical protein
VYSRNPFADLDDLPDRPKLGLKLIGWGLACVAVRFAWPHLAGDSYHAVSASFMRVEQSIGFWHSKSAAEIGDFGATLSFAAEMLLVCGTFIFFRRAVWWRQEREDEKSITKLNLK